MATNFTKELMVRPGKKVKLRKYDPDDTLGWEKSHKTNDGIERSLRRVDKAQYLLYANRKAAVLVVLQALDAGGKDGTIRHVMSGVNPQGCSVVSFKTPSGARLYRNFQPVALRGRANRAGSQPGAQRSLVEALRGDQ